MTKHAKGGLVSNSSKIGGFAIRGEGGDFVWADAEIKGTTIRLRAEGVDKPFAVHYAWATPLYNQAGLPMVPFRNDGSGPNEKRQQSPHAHQSVFSPGGQWLLVTDLGSDTIWIHAVNKDITSASPSAISMPPGAGPRHSIFHSSLPVLYTIAELDGKVYWGHWNESAGTCEWQGDIDIQLADHWI